MKNREELLYLKNVLSAIPNNIYWVDENNLFLGCNAEHAHVIGLKNEQEIIGKSYYDLIPKKYADAAIAANQEVMQSRQAKVFEELALLPDGSEAIFLSYKAPIFDQDQRVIGVVGNSINIPLQNKTYSPASNCFLNLIPKVFTNTTNYQTIGEYILAIKNYYENMLAQIPGHIYWEDSNGIILGCNNAQAQDSGLPDRKDAVGKTIFDFLPKNQVLIHQENNQSVLKTGESKIFEETSTHANGEKATYISQKIPIKDEKNNVVGILGVSIDITDRKRAEELAKEKELTEEKLRMMEAIAGFIAHEMRTPLSTLNLCLDLIEKKPEIKALDNLAEIIADGKQTIKQTDNFIDMLLMNLRKTRAKIKQEDLSLCLISDDVEEALEAYPFTEAERKLVVWNKKHSFVYLGDHLLTKHIIYNLLKNALKIIGKKSKNKIVINFKSNDECTQSISIPDHDQGHGCDERATKSQPCPRLQSGIERRRVYNQLIFIDTVGGIPNDLLPTIFDVFISHDSNKTGTGLGLAFCKMVMQTYGGEIKCESREGKYTKFILNFPKVSSEYLESAFNFPK